MSEMRSSEKQKKRFLKGVARSAALELDRLREIPCETTAIEYFYDIMETVFVRNEPERFNPCFSENKKKIGIYCMVVPEELIYAAGAVPLRLCAGSFEASCKGEDFVPRDGCPLVKSAMGFSIQKGLKIFDQCDAVIVPTTCDCKRKLAEELSGIKDVWMLELPHVKDAEFSKRIWVEQMYALKRQLEAYTKNGRPKKKINSRRLGAAIGDSLKAQSEIRRLADLRMSPSPVIWGRQAMTVINSYAYAPVKAWTKALTRLNSELSSQADKGQSVCPDTTPRILIAGSPSIFPNLKIPAIVEEMGGIVVYDESCAGDRYLYDPVGSTENNLRDQITGIASRYMAPCVCPSFTPNDDRLIILKRMASDYKADGVLYHVLKGCIIYDFEVHRLEETLKQDEIPLLRVETDYNPEDVEQLRTRIEAFIEMLKTKIARKNKTEVK